MAIASMTGYGKGVAEIDGRRLTVEIKAVNHKYLDLSIRQPKAFNFFESELRKLVSDKIRRGHLDIYLTYEDNREQKVTFKVDRSVAAGILNAAEMLSDEFGIENGLTAKSLLRFPDVLISESEEDDEAVLGQLATRALTLSLDRLNEMRTKEAVATLANIMPKLDLLSDYMTRIGELSTQSVERYRTELTEKITEFMRDMQPDMHVILTEVAAFADKVDINEEVSRFLAHIANFRRIVAEGKEVGRKLDFLIQEMNREVNTTGSKSSSREITELVIEMKHEIEKIREQIQNLE